MSLPGIRGAIIAASMLGFAGAQRLDSDALKAAADSSLVESAARFTEHTSRRRRSAPYRGRGVGSKLSKPRAAVRGW